MSHNYLNKNRTQELINTIRGHLSDIATVLSNLASGDARDNTKAPINHNQAANTITAMTGYSKPQSTSAIAATDTLNEAIGKLEKAVDDAGGGGETIPPIVINKMSDAYKSSSDKATYPTIIQFDTSKIESNPIRFKVSSGLYNITSSGTNNQYSGGFFYHDVLIDNVPKKINNTTQINYTASNYKIQGTYSNAVYALPSGGTKVYPMLYLGDGADNELRMYIYFTNSTSYTSAATIFKIFPIDFTAVTRITHGGVTVWERT